MYGFLEFKDAKTGKRRWLSVPALLSADFEERDTGCNVYLGERQIWLHNDYDEVQKAVGGLIEKMAQAQKRQQAAGTIAVPGGMRR